MPGFLGRICSVVCAMLFATSAMAADLRGWGVVVIHGKAGGPGQMSPVTSALKAAGAAVAAPQMSWSRSYRTYDETLSEIGRQVAALKARGASRIALVGQSLGANVALGYGTQRGGISAIVAMAPGHVPDRFIRHTGESVERARALVAAGRGNEQGVYRDTNQGDVYQVRTTAAAYLSFFDPNGPASFSRHSGGGASLLWIVGERDPGAQSLVRGGRAVTVRGGHGGTPRNGAQDAVNWLSTL